MLSPLPPPPMPFWGTSLICCTVMWQLAEGAIFTPTSCPRQASCDFRSACNYQGCPRALDVLGSQETDLPHSPQRPGNGDICVLEIRSYLMPL